MGRGERIGTRKIKNNGKNVYAGKSDRERGHTWL